MARKVPKISRAILMLDQGSGAVRKDENDWAQGFDLWQSPANGEATGFDVGMEFVVVVPGAVGEIAGQSGRLAVVALPDRHSYLDSSGFAAASEAEPGTALVTADRRLRGDADLVGLTPIPHVALLPMLAQGGTVLAARLSGPRATLERLASTSDLVPMYYRPSPNSETEWALIAVMTDTDLARAIGLRLSAQMLEFDPLADDLVWARVDEESEELTEIIRDLRVLYAEPGQVLIALHPDEDASALHVHGEHGHAELLAPNPDLMRTPSQTGDAILGDLDDLPMELLEKTEISPVRRKILEKLKLPCQAVTSEYESDLLRYSGGADLDTSGPVISRHIAHPDNARVEAQLIRDLQAMGYCAYRHDFTHAGQTLSNIIADLPGHGDLRIRSDILKRAREVIGGRPWPPNPKGLSSSLPDILGHDLSDQKMLLAFKRLLNLQPWFPWWRRDCAAPGIGAKLVIVGAHMDSTAGSEPGYSPTTDPAPGRDDNGSGIAAVLSIARHFRKYAGDLTHTVRFCFFNAEEQGLVGSKAYAAHLKALDAPVRAVFAIDMIGYNSDENRIFELHAGYTDPAIRDLSVPLANEIAAAASVQGMLAPAQIYRGTSWNGAPDRDIYDGAISRSDHAAFHEQGWGAVLASEDFFANLASEPNSDPNPNYHRAADASVDVDYARDIVCAMAQAIKDKAL